MSAPKDESWEDRMSRKLFPVICFIFGFSTGIILLSALASH